MYSFEEVMSFVEEENVSFIRLAFCDIHGVQKNIAIMPGELRRAFDTGISFDASAIEGFESEVTSDLLLFPDPSTLQILPWRPSSGRVVRMFCDIRRPDGSLFERDGRKILRDAAADAEKAGIRCNFGTEFEFYLFKTDEDGNPTQTPYDNAGYFDIAPLDRGENIRREICFTLQDMGITPEASHHEEGPGQQEIDFRFADPMTTADNATTFKNVVTAVAMANGAYADFSPKPLKLKSGSGMHINISVTSDDGWDVQDSFMAGIMEHIGEITLFLNPHADSYRRLGEKKAPSYISWSHGNRSQLIRIPAAPPEGRRFELRSPDSNANPYLAFAVLIYAGLDGVRRNLLLPPPTDANLFTASGSVTAGLDRLPASLEEARTLARNSSFLKSVLPSDFLAAMSLE